MKKLLFAALCLLGSTLAQADPHDCMSKPEAEKVLALLQKEGYIMDYCDCCADVAKEMDENPALPAIYLIAIKTAKIVPCEWDETQFSVKIEGTAMGYWEYNNHTYGLSMSPDMPVETNAVLNYQFYLDKGKPKQLGFWLSPKYDAPACSGLHDFPSKQEVADKKYLAWLKKRKKK